MPVNIHGKEYLTVAERIVQLVSEHGRNYSIETNVSEEGDYYVRAKTRLTLYLDQGERRYEGSAEEVRGSSQINKTSAWENCETSAIGRALAAAGYGGDEFASADEVANAITQQASGKDGRSGFATAKNTPAAQEESKPAPLVDPPTKATPTIPIEDKGGRGASDKTMGFVRKLLTERAWEISTVESECKAIVEGREPSQRDASTLIDKLLTIPTKDELSSKRSGDDGDGVPF